MRIPSTGGGNLIPNHSRASETSFSHTRYIYTKPPNSAAERIKYGWSRLTTPRNKLNHKNDQRVWAHCYPNTDHVQWIWWGHFNPWLFQNPLHLRNCNINVLDKWWNKGNFGRVPLAKHLSSDVATWSRNQKLYKCWISRGAIALPYYPTTRKWRHVMSSISWAPSSWWSQSWETVCPCMMSSSCIIEGSISAKENVAMENHPWS
jgi:hypothetical protein